MTMTDRTGMPTPDSDQDPAPRRGRDPYAYRSSHTGDVLEKRWLHKALTLINAPTGWPAWQYGLCLLLLAVCAAIPWGIAQSVRWMLWTGGATLIFLGSDTALLSLLPKWRISFGPVRPQAFILALPRLLVIVLGGLCAFWLPPLQAFIVILLVNLAASGALIWGAVIEPLNVELTTLELDAGLSSPDASAIRLLHISDLHIERIGRREERLLHLAREAAPDLIVLTGDYVNLSNVDDPRTHEQVREMLRSLHAPLGVFAVLGSPPVDRNSAPGFEHLPVRLLRDECVVVDAGGGRKLAMLGLDCSHDQAADTEQLQALAGQAPAGLFRVLLHHSPDLMPVAPQFGINLYLCGHTHGGQICLPGYGALITSSRLGKRFEAGYYQVNGTHLYVSRGVGLEGLGAPRIRFLAPPEVVLISLGE